MRPVKFEDWAKRVRLSGLGFPSSSWTAPRVAWAHDRGFLALAWELFPIRSTARRARWMLSLGLDVVIVNQPLVYVEERTRLKAG
jgi:hypothetical protein